MASSIGMLFFFSVSQWCAHFLFVKVFFYIFHLNFAVDFNPKNAQPYKLREVFLYSEKDLSKNWELHRICLDGKE